MKRLIFILIFIPFFSFGQNEYLPKIAWSTNIANSTFINTDTFTVQVTPLDLSEPGAFPLRMGNYLVDNRGLRYEIIDTTSYPTITVVDIFQEGFAPFNNKIGYVYQSAGDGNSPSLPTHTFEKLDSKALDYAYRIDNDILWKQADLYPQDSALIQFDSDTLIWDATKNDVQDIEDSLAYYMLTESFTDSIPTIKLTRFDSTGFRVTIPQVVNLLDSLNQLNNMINEGFTNAHEADPLFQDWNRTDGINIYRKQVIDLDIQYFEKELSNSENNINVGFTIDNNCLVVFNGQTLPKTAWEGNGTSLSLNLDVKMYDNLIVKKQ